MSRIYSEAELIENAIKNENCYLSSTGALVTQTGKHTGRSAKNRYIVKDSESDKNVDWGKINLPLEEAKSEQIFNKLIEKLESNKETIFAEAYVGPLPISIHSNSNWHVSFFKNMFRIHPSKLHLGSLEGRQIKIYHDPWTPLSNFGIDHNSDTIIILDLKNLRVAIIGTAYAGEIKKSAFTICNYFMPSLDVFPMHASANCFRNGDGSCVFFGLSGTGKTTLSASHDRSLIGDDEIMWSTHGLSNLEGGCYAKLIDLDPHKEPDIFNAVNQFGSIQENVLFKKGTREVDYYNKSITENTRGSYCLKALSNVFPQNNESKHPKNIVFLTADAFGALPAVARLNPMQAQYHFVSGYTAKVAGTEMGITEPKAAFSACFGAPFMPRPADTYAKQLAEKIKEQNATVWLLNTGWTQGGYGKGPRFPLHVSRRILKAIQDGELETVNFTQHPQFGFDIPTTCPGVDSAWLKAPEGPQVAELIKKFKTNEEENLKNLDAAIKAEGGPRS